MAPWCQALKFDSWVKKKKKELNTVDFVFIKRIRMTDKIRLNNLYITSLSKPNPEFENQFGERVLGIKLTTLRLPGKHLNH